MSSVKSTIFPALVYETVVLNIDRLKPYICLRIGCTNGTVIYDGILVHGTFTVRIFSARLWNFDTFGEFPSLGHSRFGNLGLSALPIVLDDTSQVKWHIPNAKHAMLSLRSKSSPIWISSEELDWRSIVINRFVGSGLVVFRKRELERL